MRTCGHMSSGLLRLDIATALPRMYMPWRARLSSTLVRFLDLRKPISPALQALKLRGRQVDFKAGRSC